MTNRKLNTLFRLAQRLDDLEVDTGRPSLFLRRPTLTLSNTIRFYSLEGSSDSAKCSLDIFLHISPLRPILLK